MSNQADVRFLQNGILAGQVTASCDALDLLLASAPASLMSFQHLNAFHFGEEVNQLSLKRVLSLHGPWDIIKTCLDYYLSSCSAAAICPQTARNSFQYLAQSKASHSQRHPLKTPQKPPVMDAIKNKVCIVAF